MSVVQSVWTVFNDYIHEGEPALRQWFLLRDITTPLVISTIYVLIVKVVGPAFMKSRKPYNIRNIIAPYNFGLVIFYVYFILWGFSFLPQLGIKCFCGSLDLASGPAAIVKMYTLGWQLYMVKYVELLDTIFLVLTKKFNMITTLHVTHHAIVPVFGFIGFRSETSAYLSVFMMINSFIHVVMYTYYGIAALGPKYQKYLWWKRYLTCLQIVQFAFILFYMAIMSHIGCITSKATFYIVMAISAFFFFLFANYYKKMFVDAPKKQLCKNESTKLPNGSVANGFTNKLNDNLGKKEE